jgi:hypothetical protein
VSEKHNIDQLLQARLEGADVPPPDFVWPRIEQELREKRRRALLWWLPLLGLAGLLIVIFWPFEQDNVQRKGVSHHATPHVSLSANGASETSSHTTAQASSNSPLIQPSADSEAISTKQTQRIYGFSHKGGLPLGSVSPSSLRRCLLAQKGLF